jgi:serine/threonine-protein kinase
MALLPFRLGRYRCLEQIGSDELAEVLRAELRGEAGFVKTYALKRFSERVTALPQFVARVTQDANRNASLEHGGIVRALGFDKLDDAHVLVTEYVDGVPLHFLLDRLRFSQDRVPWSVAVHIAIEVGKALDHAHHAGDTGRARTGIPHGGLNPNNIMLTREGGVRLLNFGLASTLAWAKKLLGERPAKEHGYLSPEQLESGVPSKRGDLFSLGVTLYEMLAGRPLFKLGAGSTRSMAPSPMEGLGEERPLLEPLLEKLLDSDPDQRFESAGDVVNRLQELQFSKGQKMSATPLVVWLEEVVRTGPFAETEFEDEVLTHPEVTRPESGESRAEGSEFDEGALTHPEMAGPGRGEAPVKATEFEDEEETVELVGEVTRRGKIVGGLPPSPPQAPAAPESAGDHQDERAIITAEIERIEQVFPVRSPRGLLIALAVTTVLCLLSTCAAVYLYVQLSRGHREAKRGTSAAGSGVAKPQTPPEIARDAASPTPVPERPASPAPFDAQPPETPPRDVMRARPKVTPPTDPDALRVVPRRGRPLAGDIEIITAPWGVMVIHQNRILGKTPLRLRGKRGKRYHLALNKVGYRPRIIRRRTSRYTGLKLRATLTHIRYLAQTGGKGQTRVEVRCKTAHIHRVYLNGRDTGRNCPVTLVTSRGTNTLGIRLFSRGKIVFKSVRSRPRKKVTLRFNH